MDRQHLLEAARAVMRRRRMSHNTEETYLYWIDRFIRHTGDRSPQELTDEEACEHLFSTAADQNISPSTRNVALSAVIFVYTAVLNRPLGCIKELERARRSHTLPRVFSRDEVAAMMGALNGVHKLVAGLLYGSGLRLQECLQLRVGDIDFQNGKIMVRNHGRHGERWTLLPESLREPLRLHLKKVREVHRLDLEEGYGEAPLPEGAAGKPAEHSTEWKWQYLFPAAYRPAGGLRRPHLDESTLQRAVKRAVRQAGITGRVSPHTFRHSFAAHMLEAGCPITMVQQLLGHNRLRTTMIYTQLLSNRSSVRSPLDQADG